MTSCLTREQGEKCRFSFCYFLLYAPLLTLQPQKSRQHRGHIQCSMNKHRGVVIWRFRFHVILHLLFGSLSLVC